MLCCASSAPRPETGTRRLFAVQSNFWINLHHFIRAVVRGMPAQAQLTAEERAVWDAGVATYKQYAARDLLMDEGMVAIKDALRRVPNDQTPPEFPNEPQLRSTLIAVAPIYRKYWWPAHDTLNRSWIAAVGPFVARYGPKLSGLVAGAYGETWPNEPIPIDLSIQAGPVGAYTSYPPHTMFSSIDRSNQGLASLELLFHESSHQWGRRLQRIIAESADARKKKVPPQLWHAVLFHNAGELTRRTLAADGITWYVPYGVPQVYTDLCGEGCREAVAKAWNPHLDGTVTMEAALDDLVAAWPSN